MPEPRVALVHDWLTNQGGGERVLWQLHLLYPGAPIFTSVFNPERLPEFARLDVRTSFLQRLPLARRRHQLFAGLRTLAFESFDFSDFDLVISTTSAEAKGIVTLPTTLHLAYIFTPTRYYWSDYHRYMADPGFGLLNGLVRLVMPTVVSRMRRWDYAAAQRPDALIADSKFVASRIAKYYRRAAEVIYAPVSLERFTPAAKRQDYYLVVSRLVPYKRVDLAIEACNKLGRRLVVIGHGSEEAKLRRLAGPTVEIITDASDEQVAKRYAEAKGFIFPAEEDFGITPLEAMAGGCPVVAYAAGGALETVKESTTGLFFAQQTVESLVAAIERFENHKFDSAEVRRHVESFGDEHFRDQIDRLATKLLEQRATT